jgi:hypothetical protein
MEGDAESVAVGEGEAEAEADADGDCEVDAEASPPLGRVATYVPPAATAATATAAVSQRAARPRLRAGGSVCAAVVAV